MDDTYRVTTTSCSSYPLSFAIASVKHLRINLLPCLPPHRVNRNISKGNPGSWTRRSRPQGEREPSLPNLLPLAATCGTGNREGSVSMVPRDGHRTICNTMQRRSLFRLGSAGQQPWQVKRRESCSQEARGSNLGQPPRQSRFSFSRTRKDAAKKKL
jgi:hypothetical protein